MTPLLSISMEVPVHGKIDLKSGVVNLKESWYAQYVRNKSFLLDKPIKKPKSSFGWVIFWSNQYFVSIDKIWIQDNNIVAFRVYLIQRLAKSFDEGSILLVNINNLLHAFLKLFFTFFQLQVGCNCFNFSAV